MSTNAIEPAVDLTAASVLNPLQTVLTPLQLTQADAIAFFDDVATLVREASGTLSFENGILTSNLTSPLGDLIGTFNLVELTTDLATSVEPLTGTFTLEGGTLVGEVSEADELLFGGTFQVTQLVNDALTTLIPQISGTIPFANGAFLVDLTTPFGEVSGTIDFGQGAIVSGLTTPFGPLNATINLGDNAQIPLTVDGSGIDLGLAFLPIPDSFEAILDLSNGLLSADLTSVLPGLVISLPLNDLSGTITLSEGQATVATLTPIGTVESSFNATSAASSLILPILENASGTVTLAEGLLTTDFTTPYGDLAGSLNVVSFLNGLANSLAEVSGTVSIENGALTGNLITPFGDLVGNFDLNEFLDASTPFTETLTGSFTA